jgi:hypothetical protein
LQAKEKKKKKKAGIHLGDGRCFIPCRIVMIVIDMERLLSLEIYRNEHVGRKRMVN